MVSQRRSRKPSSRGSRLNQPEVRYGSDALLTRRERIANLRRHIDCSAYVNMTGSPFGVTINVKLVVATDSCHKCQLYNGLTFPLAYCLRASTRLFWSNDTNPAR